jgi:hypothetical protein
MNPHAPLEPAAAALFTCCCEAGAIMGKASASARQAWTAYGQELGLAVHHLDLFDEKADLLREAARFVVARRS